MRAIQFQKTGSLSELKLQELPQPTLTFDEVLVGIHASAVNPSDVKNVLGMLHPKNQMSQGWLFSHFSKFILMSPISKLQIP